MLKRAHFCVLWQEKKVLLKKWMLAQLFEKGQTGTCVQLCSFLCKCLESNEPSFCNFESNGLLQPDMESHLLSSSVVIFNIVLGLLVIWY